MLKLLGNYKEIEEGVRILEKDYGFSLENEVTVEKNCDNKITVSIKDGACKISYCKKADFFRGLMILSDAVKRGETDFLSNEERKLNSNGIMPTLGASIMKPSTIKDFVRRMAQMGLDSMYMYMEDAYKMEKYPYFGYMRGSYTKEELIDMDSFAQKFGVELIPTIQTLGHLACTLRWRYTQPMRDTEKSLYVGADATYEFVEEMIKTCKECFSTKKIHLGMDEAYQIGKGAYLKKNGLHDPYELFSQHLDKVTEICKKYDYEPMIWSDMYLTLGSKTGKQYDPECKLPENISEMVPEGLSLVYWDYFVEDPKLYDIMFARHREMKKNIVFAGGVWQWANLVVNYGRTWRISKPALEACYRNGVKDVFMTIWGNALTADYYQTLLAFQLYAEYTYSEKVEDEQIWKMFRICTGLDPDAFWALDCDDIGWHESIERIDPIWKSVQLSLQMLFQDVMYGIFDENYKTIDLEKMYTDVLNKLNALPNQGEMEYVFAFQRKMISVLLRKSTITSKMYKAYHEGDREALKEHKEIIAGLKTDVEELYALQSENWLKFYRPFGMEHLAERYGTLILRLQVAHKRLSDFLDGKIDIIEELEEKRLRYTNHTVNHEEDIVYDQLYRSIAFITG